MAKLIIILDVLVDPALEDPHEVAAYVLDPDADDPVPTLVSAEWEEES